MTLGTGIGDGTAGDGDASARQADSADLTVAVDQVTADEQGAAGPGLPAAGHGTDGGESGEAQERELGEDPLEKPTDVVVPKEGSLGGPGGPALGGPALPDSALPDSALPDSALPDSALPDSALPDSALPDSALEDGQETGVWALESDDGGRDAPGYLPLGYLPQGEAGWPEGTAEEATEGPYEPEYQGEPDFRGHVPVYGPGGHVPLDQFPYEGTPYRYVTTAYEPVPPDSPYPAHANWGGTGFSLDDGSQDQRQRDRKDRPSGPWPQMVMVTAVAVVMAAVALAATSSRAGRLAGNGATELPSTAPTTAQTTPTNSASARSGSPSPSGPAASAKPGASGKKTAAEGTSKPAQPPAKARDLLAGPSVKAQLIRTWIATDPDGLGLTAKDVGGTVPGELYYAYDVQLSTYFAVAAFQPSQVLLKEPSTSARQADLQAFQDSEYVFSLQTGSAWTWLGVVRTGICPGEWLPSAVLAAWGMCGLKASAA
ncbi:MAG: hypothetical protein ACYCXN_06635 [Acidimicrobiales bacterium]